MKAERRHELKMNTLALAMQRLPELWKQYGTRILLALLVVGIVLVLVINRISASRERDRVETESLAIARELVDELKYVDLQVRFAAPDEIAGFRRQAISEAERFITPLTGSSDPRTRAEGLVALGDLRWLQATLPQLPGATTQPALQPDPERSRDQLLAEAEQAYQQVLDQHADQRLAAVSARFGLAAIAENRRQWDLAQQHYEHVAEDESATLAFRDQARIRLQMLDQLRHPMLIGPTAAAAGPAMPPATPAPGLSLDPILPDLNLTDPPAIGEDTPPPLQLDPPETNTLPLPPPTDTTPPDRE